MESIVVNLLENISGLFSIEDGEVRTCSPAPVVFPAGQHGHDRPVNPSSKRLHVLEQFWIVGTIAETAFIVSADFTGVDTWSLFPESRNVIALDQCFCAP